MPRRSLESALALVRQLESQLVTALAELPSTDVKVDGRSSRSRPGPDCPGCDRLDCPVDCPFLEEPPTEEAPAPASRPGPER